MYTPPQAQTIETKVAILEEKLHTTEQLMQRIESAIEKMSEVSANVTKMLAVHEQKIDGNDKVDAILFAKIDQLSNKMDTDHNIVLDKLQGLEKKSLDWYWNFCSGNFNHQQFRNAGEYLVKYSGQW